MQRTHDDIAHWASVIVATAMIIGTLAYFAISQSICEQKTCPEGKVPYQSLYSVTCMCITEPE